MKKFIILSLFLLFANSVYAEEIPKGKVTKENAPIHWQYMEDYRKAIKESFSNAKIFHLRGWGASYKFIINKNGEIKDITIDTPQNNYYNKRIKKIILKTPPSKFYEGMDEEDLLFGIYLGYQHYNDENQFVGYDIKRERYLFKISIDLDK